MGTVEFSRKQLQVRLPVSGSRNSPLWGTCSDHTPAVGKLLYVHAEVQVLVSTSYGSQQRVPEKACKFLSRLSRVSFSWVQYSVICTRVWTFRKQNSEGLTVDAFRFLFEDIEN